MKHNRLPCRRVAFLIFACMTALLPAIAQSQPADTLAKAPVKHWCFGITGGINRNYHNVDMVYMTDMRFDNYSPGSVVGLRLAYAPVSWLSINTGAVLIQKNYKMDHVFEYYNLRYGLTTSATNNYINVPLELRFSLGRKVKIHGFGGVFGGYWLSGHRTGTTYSFSNERYYDVDEDWEFNDKRDNRLETGLTWGAGLSGMIIGRIEIGADIRWYYSTSDIQKPYMVNLNPRYNTTVAVQASLSYWL